MEVKEEKEDYVEQKATYIDAISKDEDDKKPFVNFVDGAISQIKDEICQMKEEKEEVMEIGPKDEDICIDEKPALGPLLNLLPIMKIEHQDNGFGDTTLLHKDIEEQNTFESTILIKGKKEENEGSLNHITRATKNGISKSLIKERKSLSKVVGNSSVHRVCTKNLVDAFGVGQRKFSQNIASMNSVFQCEICDRSFLNKIGLSKHMLTHDNGNPLSCEECSRSFSKRANLKIHMRTHTGERPFVCKYCTKSFSRKECLKEHLRTHTGERPFVCNVCSKSFLGKSALNVHLRTHTGERPFVCNVCSKSFPSKTSLEAHLCTHTGERPFVCKYCNKSFLYKKNLKQHLGTHTGERPFICNYCTKSFSIKLNLEVHIRTHTGERPFVCKYCTKCFSRKANLMAHLRTHTGERPFVCNFCNKSYSVSSGLRAHLHTHAGNPSISMQTLH